jgi:uncharacterized protein
MQHNRRPARATAVVGHTTKRQVAFVGPFGVGKTTAVHSISDTPVVTTEVMSSIAAQAGTRASMKRTTTVGLDYGEWHAPEGKIAIVGTPGQARFRTARSSAVPRTTSLVLWCYGQNDYALEETEEWMRFIGNERLWPRLTVAVTRLEMSGGPSLESYRPMVEKFSPAIQLMAADPRERDQVIGVVRAALRLGEGRRQA